MEDRSVTRVIAEIQVTKKVRVIDNYVVRLENSRAPNRGSNYLTVVARGFIVKLCVRDIEDNFRAILRTKLQSGTYCIAALRLGNCEIGTRVRNNDARQRIVLNSITIRINS